MTGFWVMRWVAASALVVLCACGSSEGSGSPSVTPSTTHVTPSTSRVATTIEGVAHAAGCEGIEHVEPPSDRYFASSRVRCRAGSVHVLVDGFDGPAPSEWLRNKYPLGSLNPCPDGSE